ncbi:reverse transcriptase domain-containing protein [Tanacetum coccineum]
MTDAQIKALIAQSVSNALAEYEATRNSKNIDDSHESGSGIRRTERATRDALTWWNSHVKIVGHDAAYGMTWKTLRKMMTDKYCPRSEIKKLEMEIWNLKVKGTDVLSYNQHFQEFILMCRRMFPEESDEVEKYVRGLPDMIQGSVMASKPKTMQDTIEFATELMDQKVHTIAERQTKNKKKLDDNSSDNNAQQPPFKRKMWLELILLGLVRRRRVLLLPATKKTLTCYECGNQGHYMSDFLELKNQNHGNQTGGTTARGMVYALGGGETNQDPNNMEDDINA